MKNKNLIYIAVEYLHPHPNNPRKDLGDLTELAESIKQSGIMQNLTVVERAEGGYTVIIGHRRLGAAKLAGLEVVPCVIAEMSEKEQLATMMLENMQRADLTYYEQAEVFMLVDITGKRCNRLEVKAFSHMVGKRSYWVCRCDCGKFVTLRKDHFAYKYSHQKSCGCLHRESSSERMRERHERRRAAMDKNKQIEEMAKVIYGRFHATDSVTSRDIAKALYAKGYRKASEVAEEALQGGKNG